MPVVTVCSWMGSKRDEVNNTGISSQSASDGVVLTPRHLLRATGSLFRGGPMEDTHMRSPDQGSAESTSTITGAMEGVLLGY